MPAEKKRILIPTIEGTDEIDLEGKVVGRFYFDDDV